LKLIGGLKAARLNVGSLAFLYALASQDRGQDVDSVTPASAHYRSAKPE
jgi:hypothetical protein